MAVRDTTKKPYIEDRDSNIFVGIDYPFHKSNGVEGWFASTDTTIKAVKNNIKMLLNTNKGERLMQPNLGINLRKFLFEQYNDEARIAIQNEILDTFKTWLPFVEIKELDINMEETDAIGKNKMSIFITFNIMRDPNTLESIQVEIGE
jgi:phage baseplate assembly protein W|tara:strand:- start:156 stop:599 length:444 start_codon:yes stop_codon:yes gene_type:complete